MLLSSIKPGETCRIADFSKLNPLIQNRLIDLGIFEGVEVCCKNALPFGGPYMLEACGQCLSLRKKDAAAIEVE